MKKIFVLLYVLFLVQFVNAEYSLENSVKSSQIWNEIDTLEKEKPVVKAVISYCQNQIPIVIDMKKEVESYAQKVELAYKSNSIKTIISGGLALASEAVGGLSGKSLVDLGLWITNKGISLAMSDSDSFGGVSSYKRKISGFLTGQSNLTKELSKLHSISKTSDSAIKSYYTKYGKYSDLFGDLGDTGVFTTRMRLIIEQSAPTIVSLENLHYKLSQELEVSQLRLQTIDRKLTNLKNKLKELAKEQKTENVQEVKHELTDEEKNKGKVVYPNPSIYIDNKIDCGTAASRLEGLRARYKTSVEELNSVTEKLNLVRKDYYDEVNTKFVDIEKNRQKTLSKTPLPTGYETPLIKTLNAHQVWDRAVMSTSAKMIESYESIIPTLVTNIPGEDLLKTYSQLKANTSFIYGSGYQLKYSSCFNNTEAINSRFFGDKKIKKIKLIDYPQSLKKMKIDKTIELFNMKETHKRMKPFNAEKIRKLRLDIQEKRKLMSEEISRYEKAVKRNEQYENNLMSDMASLQSLYNSELFKIKNDTFGKIYELNFDIDYSKNMCKAISELQSLLNSSSVQNVITLERKIALSLGSSSMYSVPVIPKTAFQEFGKDVKSIINARVTHKNNYAAALKLHRNSSSNVQHLSSVLSNKKFYTSKQFSSLYTNLVKNASDIKSLVSNLKVEIGSALGAKRIQQQTYKNLSEYYESLLKKFKKDFSCFPLNYELTEGIAEDLIDIKELLSKLKNKPTYANMTTITLQIKKLEKDLESFYISNGNEYKNKYTNFSSQYNDYYKKINEVYFKTISPVDKKTLNDILSKIKRKLVMHNEHIGTLGFSENIQSIEDLYSKFSQYYSDKNIDSLMSFISDDWESSSDGMTLMDLEDTLDNSFSVFDEVKCTINSLNVNKIGENKYSVTYVITIIGFIYDEDIEHTEKSSVNEVIIIDNGVPKIFKTLSGQYWKTR